MNMKKVADMDFYFCNNLLDSQKAQQLADNTKILGILSIVSSCLSIIGTGSVISFVLYNRICRSPDVNSLFHLSVADLLLAIFWMVGPIIHFKHHNQGYPPLNVGYFCVTWQALCEMVHLMSFFLTINYALNVFIRMKEKKDRLIEVDDQIDLLASEQRAKFLDRLKSIAYLVSWVLPMVLITPLIFKISKSEAACQKCIILLDAPRPISNDDTLLGYNGCVVMIATLVFSILSITVLYFATLRMYKKTILCFHTNRQRVVIKAMTHRAAAYILVFIYCWTPALILASLGLERAYSKKENGDEPMILKYFGLYVVQTLSAPLQGFLNSLVYGWSRKSFRDAVTRESRRWLAATNSYSYGTIESPSTSLRNSAEIMSS